METKVIFLDIDGTLVPPGSLEPPASALAAIRAAQKKGHKVFLCTGRNLCMTSPLLEYSFDGAVCSAGGYVFCGKELLFDCPMTEAQSEGLRAILDRQGIGYSMEARDMSYSTSLMLERFKNHSLERSKMNSEAARWANVFQEGKMVRPISDYLGEPIYKICYLAPDEAALAPVRQQYEREFIFCQQNFPEEHTGWINGELINRRFNKGTGIRKVCAHLGLTTADAIGFGDSENDLEMTDVVGLSICMENGSEELKKRCSAVCPPVDEDGIARAFESLGLV